jgi:Uma2 family endonuclease
MRAALWPVTRPLTCDDLWRIREASAERLEIIDGELFATSPSTPMHQAISGRLSFEFGRAVGESHLGQVFFAMLNVRLAIDTVVLPDIMIILRDRFATIADWGIDGSPSLLAEIASTHSDYRDRALKPEIYALYDVPEYWIVEPEDHHIRIFSNPRDGRYQAEKTASDVVVSATIPGLRVDLATIVPPKFGD